MKINDTSNKIKNVNDVIEVKDTDSKEIQRWKKRIICFRFIYSVLVMNLNEVDSYRKLKYELPEFANDEMSNIIIFFIKNKLAIFSKIESLLNENWTLDRLNKVDLAIIISAYCEFLVTGINRKIIIDQAIITSKKYSEKSSYKFINFILDKILPKE